MKIRAISKIVAKKIRYYLIKNKLGGNGHFVRIGKNVVINNPQCLYFGKNVGIGDNVFLNPIVRSLNVHYHPRIEIGDGTWIGKNCSLSAINGVTIGSDVLFAGFVHITDHSHGYEDPDVPIAEQKLISKGPIIIDDQCWLGFNCEILSGVHIGRHSIVAARAVVTKDVPSYSIVAGNPARIVKQYNFETKKWERTKQSNM